MHFRPYEPMENMSTETWMRICPIEIPIDVLIPSQEKLSDVILPEGHSYCGDVFPHVVYYKGGLFISDGHNRVREAFLRGEDVIMARLKFKNV